MALVRCFRADRRRSGRVLYSPHTAVYTRSALVMVKEDSKGRSIGSDISSLFSDLGLTQASANVNNELLAMQTPAAILETIKRLNLDIDYRTDGFFRKETLVRDLVARKGCSSGAGRQ